MKDVICQRKKIICARNNILGKERWGQSQWLHMRSTNTLFWSKQVFKSQIQTVYYTRDSEKYSGFGIKMRLFLQLRRHFKMDLKLLGEY